MQGRDQRRLHSDRKDALMMTRSPSQCKQCLVALGLYALSRGEWHMVMAITRLIQRKGYANA